MQIYRKASQCIRLTRNPGNTKRAPVIAHHKATQSFNINLEAGPLHIVYNNHLSKMLLLNKSINWYTLNRVFVVPEILLHFYWKRSTPHRDQIPSWIRRSAVKLKQGRSKKNRLQVLESVLRPLRYSKSINQLHCKEIFYKMKNLI